MISLLLALVVGTWNGNWFPSGRAEHRAPEAVEAATIAAAGKMLAEGIRLADPEGKDEVVLALCEIRNREIAERLVGAIGREGLKVASISAYRRRDRFDQQQNAILTTLSVTDSSWANWKPVAKANPPRGYATAGLELASNCETRVYCVHLKSNYGATTPEIAALCRRKRTNAINEFLRLTKKHPSVILAGDFNADRWRKEFAEETIFADLERAGFANLADVLPPECRGTHPNRRFGESTLDYIMVRGFAPVGLPIVVPSGGISDHHAVFARVAPTVISRKAPSRSRRHSRPARESRDTSRVRPCRPLFRRSRRA